MAKVQLPYPKNHNDGVREKEYIMIFYLVAVISSVSSWPRAFREYVSYPSGEAQSKWYANGASSSYQSAPAGVPPYLNR